MPSLKYLRTRIQSVKSTRKITSAMKMIAATKLRKAQSKAEANRPYTDSMMAIMNSLTATIVDFTNGPQLLIGTGKSETVLFVVASSDRGLCGGFNSNLIRQLKRKVRSVEEQGKKVKFITIGKKARQLLSGEYGEQIVERFEGLDQTMPFTQTSQISNKVLEMFEGGEFDECILLFNEFISVIKQEVKFKQIIPLLGAELSSPSLDHLHRAKGQEAPKVEKAEAVFEFEPEEETILEDLLPKNVALQIHRALIESAASEHGARMTAMDNATRNAGEMIHKLSLKYNRTRQAVITSELIEIISGAEAL